DPIKEETFYAVKNMGAYLNDNIITVSSNNKLSESMVATGFAYDRDKSGNNNLDNFKRLALKAKGIRRMGAAALDLAYVASGRFDGFWESGLKLWDMAAGKLLVEEAGGKITDLKDEEWKILGDNIVASNNLIHEELIKHLKEI
ncbi:MAG: inositol monophosphatase, partial [Candidatus Mcinerneyibacterium aminivorans]